MPRILISLVIPSGDRLFGEDTVFTIGGLGKIDNQSVMLIGHEKGNDTETRAVINLGWFIQRVIVGKSIRVSVPAEQFNIPVITLLIHQVLTQVLVQKKEAIGKQLLVQLIAFSLKVPVISMIIGEAVLRRSH